MVSAAREFNERVEFIVNAGAAGILLVPPPVAKGLRGTEAKAGGRDDEEDPQPRLSTAPEQIASPDDLPSKRWSFSFASFQAGVHFTDVSPTTGVSRDESRAGRLACRP